MWVGKFAADLSDLSIINFVSVNQIQWFILPFFAFFCSPNSGKFLILSDFVLRIASVIRKIMNISIISLFETVLCLTYPYNPQKGYSIGK
jgi:hypothetical protein